MNSQEITRRQVLHAGAVAASLAAMGKLPLLTAGEKTLSGIDPGSAPYAVKPIRNYLRRFAPASGNLAAAARYTLTYEIIHWAGSTAAVSKAANPTIGKLIIARAAEPNAVRYNIRQTTVIGGVDNVIKADIECADDDFDSIKQWTVDHHFTTPDGKVDSISRLHEEGHCKSGRIEIDNGIYRKTLTANVPVVTQWTILGMLTAGADRPLNAHFSLLQDLSLLKRDQHLRREGNISLTVKADKTVNLTHYVHTGNGILPIDYLVDSKGLPQLITASMVSWALTGCRTT